MLFSNQEHRMGDVGILNQKQKKNIQISKYCFAAGNSFYDLQKK
jgi:hypothetical protein